MPWAIYVCPYFMVSIYMNCKFADIKLNKGVSYILKSDVCMRNLRSCTYQ